MKIGTDNPKQVAAAGILVCVAAYAMYTQVLAPADGPAYSRPATPMPAAPAPLNTASLKATEAMETARKSAEARGADARQVSRRKGSAFGEWVPTLKPKKPEDRPDPAKVNPALRTELLAKLQGVTAAGGGRNLFEFGIAQAKPIDDVKIALGKKGTGKKGADGVPAVDGAKPADPPKASDSKPPAPPVPLKYYGFVAGSGKRQAFFLNGEEIFAVAEGQTIQSRFKVIRIGDVSAIIEDLQYKNQQTIKLEEPPNT